MSDGFRAHGGPNEIVQVELGSPISFHSLADTFLNAIVVSFMVFQVKLQMTLFLIW
jgi:hypothetical protein